MRRWAPTGIVVALLAATAVAFATTERRKLEKTPFAVLRVDRTFSPRCRCTTNGSTISLRFRRRHVLTLQILKGERVFATLADERTVKGFVNLRWDGAGAPDGIYRPNVVLDDGREFDLRTPIRVDATAPTAHLVRYHPRVLKRRAKPRVRVFYRVSEAAHPLLYVNGRKVLGPGFAKSLKGDVQWFVPRRGRRLRPGRYRLQLAAVDLAGNTGPRTRPFVVRVR